MRKSKLSALLKEELILTNKKIKPRERLNAFFRHSQFLMRLFIEGESYRKCTASNSFRGNK